MSKQAYTNCLLVVDMQNDFVDKSGSLYVEGAENALDNLVKMLDEYDNGEKRQISFNTVILTQDSHIACHVSMSDSWIEKPAIGTVITKQDILDGKFHHIAGEKFDRVIVEKMDAIKRPEINIWPNHCVMGTHGWAFPDRLMTAITNWINRGWASGDYRHYRIEMKGMATEYESYSLFTAYHVINRTKANHVSSIYDDILYSQKVNTNGSFYRFPYAYTSSNVYGHVYICGVAGDYCVHDTLLSLLDDKFDYTFMKNSEAAPVPDAIIPMYTEVGTIYQNLLDSVYMSDNEKKDPHIQVLWPMIAFINKNAKCIEDTYLDAEKKGYLRIVRNNQSKE